jgi:hypothetical protein
MVLQRTSLPLEGALVLRDRQGLTFYIQVYIQVPRVINVASELAFSIFDGAARVAPAQGCATLST